MAAERGRVAFERGPLVYCAEWPDNEFDIHHIIVNQNPKITATNRPDIINGLITLTTDAQTLAYDATGALVADKVKLTLIPYYTWCHRGKGNMAVWLPQSLSTASVAE